MYTDILAELFTPTTGALAVLASNVGEAFMSALPIAIPVVGGIAIGFFAIKVVRGLLHV